MRTRWSWIVVGAGLLGGLILVHTLVAQQSPIARKLLEKVLEEQGLSPEDVRNDPALQQEIQEILKQRRRDPAWRAQVREMLVQWKRQEQRDNSSGYQAIAQHNLFKPLGSGEENQGPEFELQGTYIASNGGVKRALIFDFRTNQLRDVQEGDTIRDAKVLQIEHRYVKLERGGTGETIDLRPNENLFISTHGGGERGRPGRPGGGSQQVRNPSGERSPQPAVNPQEMRERMQGRSPEEIRRMMEERMRRFREQRARSGGDAGGRARRVNRAGRADRVISR